MTTKDGSACMRPDDLALARGFAHARYDEALELLRTLARIPAPSLDEGRRASFVRSWMHANGMAGAYIDEATNVICPIRDDGRRGLVVFAAHLDVVFPDTDELPLREEGGRLHAPGVGDDTANLVALLMAARELSAHPELLPPDLGALVVADSGEEGLGNLRGTRQLFSAYGLRIRRFYSFDLYLPQCISTAVGSLRWEIAVRTQGGHSFGDYGRPNAIERLCGIIRELYALGLPQGATCTMNVGTIEGGTGVNAIASEAKALFEYRSTSDGALKALEGRLREVIGRFVTPEVSVELTSRGVRPASADTPNDRLRQLTETSCDVIGSITGETPDQSPASTDANVPLSLGIPANTIGAVRGALLHTRDEWVDAASIKEGLAVVMGIMLAQRDLG